MTKIADREPGTKGSLWLQSEKDSILDLFDSGGGLEELCAISKRGVDSLVTFLRANHRLMPPAKGYVRTAPVLYAPYAAVHRLKSVAKDSTSSVK